MKTFSQVNFRKSHEISDQFDKSIKSYIKMFEAASLLAPRPKCPSRIKKRLRHRPYPVNFAKFLSTPILKNTCAASKGFKSPLLRSSLLQNFSRSSNTSALSEWTNQLLVLKVLQVLFYILVKMPLKKTRNSCFCVTLKVVR